MSHEVPENCIYDLIGIGFGPSNLALSTAIAEHTCRSKMRAIFLEQKSTFAWHPNMLIPETVMQISFLKDLVTQRNPGSKFSFLQYLQRHGRLGNFINKKSFYPSRIEFDKYMAWVAEKMQQYVSYGCEVSSVSAYGAEPHQYVEVCYRDHAQAVEKKIYARKIVTAVGGVPQVPFALQVNDQSERVWHSSQYLNKIAALGDRVKEGHRFVVVGRGQSAAEIVNDLYGKYPNANITCIFRGYGIKPSDSSEFVNEVFDASFVDEINAAPRALRDKIVAEHWDTNYSVVDLPLISRLYELQYSESVTGKTRLGFKNFTVVERVVETEHGAQLYVKNGKNGANEQIDAETVILSTGYEYPNPPTVLASIASHFVSDVVTQQPKVNRNYRVQMQDSAGFKVYLQGCNEATHGLGDTLLSNIAIRAGDILDDMLQSGLEHEHIQLERTREKDFVAA